MAGESSSSGRGGIFSILPLWLIILLLISVIIAVLAVAALTITFLTRSDTAALPTLAATADLPTSIAEGIVPPTVDPEEPASNQTEEAGSTSESEESVDLPPTNTITSGGNLKTREALDLTSTSTVEAGATSDSQESLEMTPTNTSIGGVLVPTYTPFSFPSQTKAPVGTSTPRSTRANTPTRPPLPTNTRYIPPPPKATATLPATAPPQSTSTAAASTIWKGEYFNNQDLSGAPSLVRQDPQINFDWGSGSPGSEIQSDHFSARWTRTAFFAAGTYTINIFSDDGVRMWIDNQLIIDEWHNSTNVTYTALRTLTEGNHELKVEYFEDQGNATIRVWEESGDSYPQWRGEYFDNQDLASQPVLVRNDAEINFNWGSGSPANVIPADHFSVRWTREMGFNAEEYVFNARSDDGVRVWFDGHLIIDQWHDADGDTVYHAIQSVSSGIHSLKVEYFENFDQAFIQIWWEPVSSQTFWNGQYFSNKTLSGSPAMTRSDTTVNFNWGLGSPGSNIPDDAFSARWDRIFEFSKGTYRFYSSVDDGIRILVDGKILIDSWKAEGKQNVSADIKLEGHHQIIIEYFEEIESASIRTWWEKISG